MGGMDNITRPAYCLPDSNLLGEESPGSYRALVTLTQGTAYDLTEYPLAHVQTEDLSQMFLVEGVAGGGIYTATIKFQPLAGWFTTGSLLSVFATNAYGCDLLYDITGSGVLTALGSIAFNPADSPGTEERVIQPWEILQRPFWYACAQEPFAAASIAFRLKSKEPLIHVGALGLFPVEDFRENFERRINTESASRSYTFHNTFARTEYGASRTIARWVERRYKAELLLTQKGRRAYQDLVFQCLGSRRPFVFVPDLRKIGDPDPISYEQRQCVFGRLDPDAPTDITRQVTTSNYANISHEDYLKDAPRHDGTLYEEGSAQLNIIEEAPGRMIGL